MFSKLKDWLTRKLLGYEPLRAKVNSLDDEGIYLWICEEGEADSVRETILIAYEEEYNREPNAVHIVAPKVKELEKLNIDKLKKMMPEG